MDSAATRLKDMVLGCLKASKSWPGADGLTAADIFVQRQKAVAEVPELQELLRSHPGTVDELEDFFASQQRGEAG
jgi:hypothetical protein